MINYDDTDRTTQIMQYNHIGNGIMNARLLVSDNVAVSLSYSLPSSPWQSVGTKEQPQGAILFYGLVGIEDLYSFGAENTNTKQCTTQKDIDALVTIASSLKPTHCIYIFDFADRCFNKDWHPRFIVDTNTDDFLFKSAYLHDIYDAKDIKVEVL